MQLITGPSHVVSKDEVNLPYHHRESLLRRQVS